MSNILKCVSVHTVKELWVYTIIKCLMFSFISAYTDCKHFLVDASSGKYCFVGPKQQKFNSLPELLRFYRYITNLFIHALPELLRFYRYYSYMH